MSDYVFINGEPYNADELMHYGVPGMKWGHRKALLISDTRKRLNSAKEKYKQANREYNKAFKKANRYSSTHVVSQFVGKKAKAESDKRWDDAYDKARKADSLKKEYKKAKKQRKNSINKTFQKIQKDASFGEKLIYNKATRKKAAKYVVDNNMSMSDAKKKANGVAIRNTAIAVAALGAYAVYNAKR